MNKEWVGNHYRKPGELAAWSALQTEEAIEPDLPIIDAHHHIWNTERDRYLLADYQTDARSGHNVVASVYIECTSAYRTAGPDELRPVGETESIASQTAAIAHPGPGEPRVAAAIVGFADLSLGEKVGPVLDAHIAAGDHRFRGIRRPVCWDPVIGARAYKNAPEKLASDNQFRAGVKELEARDLTFEAWAYHRQLPELLELARKFPNLSVVLNHLGGLLRINAYRERRSEEFAFWRQSMRDLAETENVVVKIGGLGMLTYGFDFEQQPVPPHSVEIAEAWGPLIDTAIECFGPSRCMFESNFSVDNQSCTYVSLWNAYKRRTQSLSPAERTALFSGTAACIYRIEMP